MAHGIAILEVLDILELLDCVLSGDCFTKNKNWNWECNCFKL